MCIALVYTASLTSPFSDRMFEMAVLMFLSWGNTGMPQAAAGKNARKTRANLFNVLQFLGMFGFFVTGSRLIISSQGKQG